MAHLVWVQAAGDTVFILDTAATGETRGTLIPPGVRNRAAARGLEIWPCAQVA